jgi:hypothetical protein
MQTNTMLFIATLVVAAATLGVAISTLQTNQRVLEITEIVFKQENFDREILIETHETNIDKREYDGEIVTITMSVSGISPRHNKLVIQNATLFLTDTGKLLLRDNDVTPKVIIDKPIKKFLPAPISNMDIEIPIRLTLPIESTKLEVKSAIPGMQVAIHVGHIKIGIDVIDVQTQESLSFMATSELNIVSKGPT